jgi:8-oxo-dGTP diphosphatase
MRYHEPVKLIQTMDYSNPQRRDVTLPDRTFGKMRQAVRAIVSDEQGGVYLMHAAKHGYYKLSGGGIDAGEQHHEALARELAEEMGAQSFEVTGEVGQTVQFDDADDFCQRSYCYQVRLTGELGEPELTESEAEAGFEVERFENVAAAIEAVTNDGHAAKYNFMTVRDAALLTAAVALPEQS